MYISFDFKFINYLLEDLNTPKQTICEYFMRNHCRLMSIDITYSKKNYMNEKNDNGRLHVSVFL